MAKVESIKISSTWQPTPDAINTLPEPLRRYIHDLETNADPAGMVRENAILRAQLEALTLRLASSRKKNERPAGPKKRRQ